MALSEMAKATSLYPHSHSPPLHKSMYSIIIRKRRHLISAQYWTCDVSETRVLSRGETELPSALCVHRRWVRQPGLSSPHHFLVRNTIMDDNEIFFRKQGIRTTIIVNKMLVLIKMISLFCFGFFCFFQALLHCHYCCCAHPWWYQDGWP